MDIFIYILAGLSAVLIVRGIAILCNRSLEIGRLFGIIWVLVGAVIGAFAAILWVIQHVTLAIT